MELNYKPVAERTVDEQYKRLIREVKKGRGGGGGILDDEQKKFIETIKALDESDLKDPTQWR
mgnify:CR=1 FL=1